MPNSSLPPGYESWLQYVLKYCDCQSTTKIKDACAELAALKKEIDRLRQLNDTRKEYEKMLIEAHAEELLRQKPTPFNFKTIENKIAELEIR